MRKIQKVICQLMALWFVFIMHALVLLIMCFTVDYKFVHQNVVFEYQIVSHIYRDFLWEIIFQMIYFLRIFKWQTQWIFWRKRTKVDPEKLYLLWVNTFRKRFLRLVKCSRKVSRFAKFSGLNKNCYYNLFKFSFKGSIIN